MGFKGGDKHLKRLRRMQGAARKEGQKLVYTLADMHATEAAISITTGAVSGKGHVPSKPGEPPNADTHMLDRSVEAVPVGPLKANSVATAPYAAALEFGSSNVAERPFMRPAAKKVRKDAEKLKAKAVKVIVRGGTL